MKRFFTALAAVALAGAIYVATAPGSQTASPTAQQFTALKKQVAKLQKDEKAVKKLAKQEAFLLADCMNTALPIGEYGDGLHGPFAGTFGYSYKDPTLNGGTPFLTTALDVAGNTDPNAFWVTGTFAAQPAGGSACATDLNPALRKLSRLAGIHLHVAARHSLSAHRR